MALNQTHFWRIGCDSFPNERFSLGSIDPHFGNVEDFDFFPRRFAADLRVLVDAVLVKVTAAIGALLLVRIRRLPRDRRCSF